MHRTLRRVAASSRFKASVPRADLAAGGGGGGPASAGITQGGLPQGLGVALGPTPGLGSATLGRDGQGRGYFLPGDHVSIETPASGFTPPLDGHGVVLLTAREDGGRRRGERTRLLVLLLVLHGAGDFRGAERLVVVEAAHAKRAPCRLIASCGNGRPQPKRSAGKDVATTSTTAIATTATTTNTAMDRPFVHAADVALIASSPHGRGQPHGFLAFAQLYTRCVALAGREASGFVQESEGDDEDEGVPEGRVAHGSEAADGATDGGVGAVGGAPALACRGEFDLRSSAGGAGLARVRLVVMRTLLELGGRIDMGKGGSSKGSRDGNERPFVLVRSEAEFQDAETAAGATAADRSRRGRKAAGSVASDAEDEDDEEEEEEEEEESGDDDEAESEEEEAGELVTPQVTPPIRQVRVLPDELRTAVRDCYTDAAPEAAHDAWGDGAPDHDRAAHFLTTHRRDFGWPIWQPPRTALVPLDEPLWFGMSLGRAAEFADVQAWSWPKVLSAAERASPPYVPPEETVWEMLPERAILDDEATPAQLAVLAARRTRFGPKGSMPPDEQRKRRRQLAFKLARRLVVRRPASANAERDDDDEEAEAEEEAEEEEAAAAAEAGGGEAVAAAAEAMAAEWPRAGFFEHRDACLCPAEVMGPPVFTDDDSSDDDDEEEEEGEEREEDGGGSGGAGVDEKSRGGGSGDDETAASRRHEQQRRAARRSYAARRARVLEARHVVAREFGLVVWWYCSRRVDGFAELLAPRTADTSEAARRVAESRPAAEAAKKQGLLLRRGAEVRTLTLRTPIGKVTFTYDPKEDTLVEEAASRAAGARGLTILPSTTPACARGWSDDEPSSRADEPAWATAPQQPLGLPVRGTLWDRRVRRTRAEKATWTMARDARSTSYWYFAPASDGEAGVTRSWRVRSEEELATCSRKEAKQERKDWGQANRRAVGAAQHAVERLLQLRREFSAAQRKRRREARERRYAQDDEEEDEKEEEEESGEEESDGSEA